MPVRTANTVSTAKGTTVSGPRGAKKFIGKGPAPSGTKKAPEPSYSEVPTVITAPSGKVTTTNFPDRKAAKAAVKRSRASKRKVRRIERAVAQSRRNAVQRKSTSPLKVKAQVERKYTPPPTSKPETYKGLKTAGTPTLKSLQTAEKTGTLKVKNSFASTPQVRSVAREFKQAQRQVAKSTRAKALPLPTKEQRQVARKVLSTGKRAGATKKELLAAAETGLVESNFKNLGYGDADSEGWRQERTSIYGTGPTGPRNVKAGAKRFFEESLSDTGGTRGRGQTAGQLAQTIQGSAFPERYDEVKPQANAIVKAFLKGKPNPKAVKQLKAAKAKAASLGLKVAEGAGPAPKKVVTRFKAAKQAMKEVEGLPYVWGGGHGSSTSSPTGGGLDCSGAVGYVLNKIGALKGSLTSGDMGSVLKPGPGALTVFYNPEHTFLRIGNEYWGTSVGDSGAGGLGPHPAPSAAYLSQYNVGHVPGLGKKQALQLGFKNLATGGAQTFPGMTLSASGTQATVNPDSAATKDKPGFSKSPIKLTRLQKYEGKLRKLENLGVGVGTATEAAAPTTTTLKSLEEKYSRAVN